MQKKHPSTPRSVPDHCAGIVEKVMFKNPDDGLTILRVVTSDGETLSLKGKSFVDFQPGDSVTAEGERGSHERFGPYLLAEAITTQVPTDARGVYRWLCHNGVEGAGTKTANVLFEYFQENLCNVVSDPRTMERAGISQRRAMLIANRWNAIKADPITTAYLWLLSIGVGKVTAQKIAAQYGSSTKDIVEKDPWSLSRTIAGLGFLKADELARRSNISKTAPSRMASAIDHVLDENTSAGSTLCSWDRLQTKAARLLGNDPEVIDAFNKQCQRMILSEQLCCIQNNDQHYVAKPSLSERESELAEIITTAVSAPSSHHITQEQIIRAATARGMVLDGQQLAACKMIYNSTLSVVTGGPGCGKTTILTTVLEALGGVRKRDRAVVEEATGMGGRRRCEGATVVYEEPSGTLSCIGQRACPGSENVGTKRCGGGWGWCGQF